MNEHDDDLESKVYEDSDEEIDGYPNTGDELDEREPETPNDEDEERPLDDDPAEL
jgi:hypothetical protein